MPYALLYLTHLLFGRCYCLYESQYRDISVPTYGFSPVGFVTAATAAAAAAAAEAAASRDDAAQPPGTFHSVSLCRGATLHLGDADRRRRCFASRRRRLQAPLHL